MTSTPPPPPPPARPNEVQEKVPPIAWLVPVAGVLAVIGLVTPWFKPQYEASRGSETRSGDAVDDALYSFKEGRLGLIAPIVLVVVAFGVARLLTGRSSRFHRGSRSPVQSAAFAALGAGVAAGVTLALSYFLLPTFYKFKDGGRELDWDDAETFIRQALGASKLELTQGPQVGFWISCAAALVAIVAGALMLVMRQAPQPVGTPGAPPPPGQAPPQQGYGAPQQGYGAPEQGHGAQPSGYGAPQQGYGAQQPGYGAPQQSPQQGSGPELQKQPPPPPPGTQPPAS